MTYSTRLDSNTKLEIEPVACLPLTLLIALIRLDRLDFTDG